MKRIALLACVLVGLFFALPAFVVEAASAVQQLGDRAKQAAVKWMETNEAELRAEWDKYYLAKYSAVLLSRQMVKSSLVALAWQSDDGDLPLPNLAQDAYTVSVRFSEKHIIPLPTDQTEELFWLYKFIVQIDRRSGEIVNAWFFYPMDDKEDLLMVLREGDCVQPACDPQLFAAKAK